MGLSRFFGNVDPSLTTIDPAILNGWGVRPYNWQFGTSVQQLGAVGQPLSQLRSLLGGAAVVGAESLDRSREIQPFCREHA